MNKSRRSRLTAYVIAASVLAITGCIGPLSSEITLEPKPLAVTPRNCQSGPLEAAACLADAVHDSIMVSPRPQPPDSTLVGSRVSSN